MTCQWGDILTRMNVTSKKLQSVNIDIGEYFKELELLYDCYEEQGKNLSGADVYEEEKRRKKNSTRFFDDSPRESENEDQYNASVNIKTDIYNAILRLSPKRVE